MPEMTNNGAGAARGEDGVRALLEAGGAIGGARYTGLMSLEEVPYAVVPQGYKLESLERFVRARWIRQTVVLSTARSFIDYVNRFSDSQSVIFATVTDAGAQLLAVLDYHVPDEAQVGHCEHCASWDCPQTRDWKTWTQADRKEMTQEQFALFLEDNGHVFKTPGGADLLELVTTLEGRSDVQFASAVRLQNGKVALRYEDAVTLTGGQGSGQIEIPQRMVVVMQVFEGGTAYEFEARLRYRIAQRKLTFWFETVRRHEVIRRAAEAAVEQVREETKRMVFLGGLSA